MEPALVRPNVSDIIVPTELSPSTPLTPKSPLSPTEPLVLKEDLPSPVESVVESRTQTENASLQDDLSSNSSETAPEPQFLEEEKKQVLEEANVMEEAVATQWNKFRAIDMRM